jgi:hypothetical protein
MGTLNILPDYPDGPIPGFPGDVADIGLKDTISRQNTGANPISFGAAVIDGPVNAVVTSGDYGCQAYATGKRVIGFAKSDYSLRPMPITNPQPLQYLTGDMVQVERDVRMRQLATADVLAGAPVTVDPATGIVTVGGADTVPGCFWETNTKANHVGIIQILITT